MQNTQVFANTAVQSIQEQIANTNSQIQALDREIAQYQSQISQTTQKSNTLANIIKELTITRNKLLAEKKQIEKKITNTGFVITALNNDIKEEEGVVRNSQKSLAQMIKDLHRRDQTVLIEQLLSQENMSEASREYNDIISFNAEIKKLIISTQESVVTLESSKEKKEGEKKNLTTLQKNLTQKELAVVLAKKEKDTILKETKNTEAGYKKLLAEREKKRDEFEKALENYESQLKFILNPKSLPKEGSGVLSWPLDTVFVTQLFGKTISARRLYTSGSHSGVDFRASVGTPVKSMANGTVAGVGDTDIYCRGASFGKWVFIKYDNGLSSTYGHLSAIQAKAGQRVSTGDVVGLSGNTGHSTGPHLHVTVYASEGADVKTVPSLSCAGKTFIMPIAATKAYLDPMLYLPKLLASAVKKDTPRD